MWPQSATPFAKHGGRMSQTMAHACDSVGGQAASLVQSDDPRKTVSDWVNGKSLVDPELVVEIERITGVSRHDLRPDLSRVLFSMATLLVAQTI